METTARFTARRLIAALAMLTGGEGVLAADSDPRLGAEWTGEAATMWHSRYIDFGADELDGGGLWTLESTARTGEFETGIWVGIGDQIDYQELNLHLAHGFELGPIEAVLRYTRLEFKGERGDHEVSLELASRLPGGLEWDVETVFSTEAKGAFIELGLTRPFRIGGDRVQFAPYLRQGFDFGYRTPAHDGPNHTTIGLETEVALSPDWTLFTFVSHSFAGDDIQREGGGDQTWCGFGLGTSF